MGKRGRPPVLDAVKKAQILAILSVGCSRRVAAEYAGCARSTIIYTARRDAEFAASLRKATHSAEIGYLKNIQKAARKEQYWRAAAWALERMLPEKYARRGPDVVTPEEMADELIRFAKVVMREVPAERDRKRIVKRLGAMTRGCRATRGRKPLGEAGHRSKTIVKREPPRPE
jgi:hypothetical protein